MSGICLVHAYDLRVAVNCAFLTFDSLLTNPRSFCIAGPKAWNSLPLELRNTELSFDTFCSRLKSHLFTPSYTFVAPVKYFQARIGNLLLFLLIICAASIFRSNQGSLTASRPDDVPQSQQVFLHIKGVREK